MSSRENKRSFPHAHRNAIGDVRRRLIRLRKLVHEQNDLSRYVKHPRHALTPGSYTDDTQMSIAIVEAMLAGFKWTPELLADRFVHAFKRDPREGYAGAFHQFLTEIRDGDEFLARIRPNSEKSGAAMRAGPIGLYPTIQDVMKQAARQAALTHDTPLGIRAAQAAALMTHYCHFQLGPRISSASFSKSTCPANRGPSPGPARSATSAS